MKKISLVVYLILIINTISSQEINYIPYYQAINKANLSRCRQNYDSALIYYGQAFQIVDYILMDDLRNFAKCATIEKKDSLIYFAMEQCIKQIVPLNYIFESDTIFEQYQQTDKWQYYMEQEKKNIEMYHEKYSCPYKKVMDSLRIEDQKIRTLAWRLTKKRRQKASEIEYSNRRAIDELIAKYDYPNERNGLFNQSCLWAPMIVIFHYHDTVFFQNTEYKAYIEGKLTPYCFSKKAQRVVVFNNLPFPRYRYEYSPNMTEEEKAQVDKNRYEIGLPSIEEERIINQCNDMEYQKIQEALKQQRKK
ncbi:MAG: hypothetical protein LBL13_07805 [Bacteroidales bacterium]|jgi:hypothetical protein|nr:hypothetical protein [Bacteroidales bacterium]